MQPTPSLFQLARIAGELFVVGATPMRPPPRPSVQAHGKGDPIKNKTARMFFETDRTAALKGR